MPVDDNYLIGGITDTKDKLPKNNYSLERKISSS